MNSSRSRAYSTRSVAARTVAVLGRSRSNAISPMHSPGPTGLAPWEDRQRGDVDERVPGAEGAEHHERHDGFRQDPDHDQRRAPQHHAAPKIARDPPRADERGGHRRADETADPHRRVEVAEP